MNIIYYITVIFTDEGKDGLIYQDIENKPVSLEEGIAQISQLMVKDHPDDYEINFFGVVKDGKLVELEADHDGWFAAPVFHATLTRDPANIPEILFRRSEMMANTRALPVSGKLQ